MLSTSPPPPVSLPFLTSPLSPQSSPSRARFSPSLATATATASSTSYTCTNEPPRVSFSSRISNPSASMYEILGIPISATSQEIKAAYRRLARICHPDVTGTDRGGSSADEFIKIHSAYCTLSDPEKRAVYDRKFLRRSRPLTVGVSGYRGYAGRNWETDQCW